MNKPQFLQNINKISPFYIRLLIAAMFVESCIDKALHWAGYTAQVVAVGMPLPTLSLAAAAATECLGSIALISGKCLQVGSLILAVYVCATGFVFFDFWNLQGPASVAARKEFLKGLAVAGGLLLLAITRDSLQSQPTTKGEP